MQWLFPFIVIWSLFMIMIAIHYYKSNKCPTLKQCEII